MIIKTEIDTDRFDLVAKEIRELAEKHKLSMEELGQITTGVIAHAYYLSKTFGLN